MYLLFAVENFSLVVSQLAMHTSIDLGVSSARRYDVIMSAEVVRACASSVIVLVSYLLLSKPFQRKKQMDHFPTNWGRPVRTIISIPLHLLKSFCLQRNDAFDMYGTYPIAQRPQNDSKGAFSLGVQRTQ